jgi:16S rRNA (adenine1518-N6/adenine1519-N6)-dimethyltransferase
VKPHRPRKRFGQHFLKDPAVIDAIVAAIAPADDDLIVEIGPGPGVLTAPLARRCRELHVVELDRDLAAGLQTRYAGSGHVHVHQADALRFDFGLPGEGVRVVGNLPYNISTPLLFHLLNYRQSIADMHFMLQKEVVDRMAAAPGSRTYGRLSVMLGCHLEIEALFDVDRQAFDPPPEVTSSVVRLRPLAAGTYRIADERLLAHVVAAAFSQRRKTLRNALKGIAGEGDYAAAGIDPGLRAEAIPVPGWVALANHLAVYDSQADGTKSDNPA